jgi:membrane fusion protein, copper/silver efflux system
MSDSTDSQQTFSRKKILIVALVIAAFALGYYLPQRHQAEVATVNIAEDSHDHSKDKKPTLWTCSMHPQIKLPKPGKCPICFMDLIPLETETDAGPGAGLVQYSMSETARKLAEVETTPVRRQPAKVTVRMVGQVYEDETRQATLTARVDGRLDEIYINFTGVSVNKGDPMVKIWSPTLIKSQVELFETIRSDTDQAVLRGAEEKLIQYGMTQEQVDEIKKKKKPNLYVTLRAPISGVVTKKLALLGQFVKEGQDMYMINDFSRVWVKMDAYESDLPWIRYGQDVTFTTPAAPGRQFQGKVLFIDPMLDTKTRSVKIRVEADNPDLILKTGMFVSAELQAELDANGRVIKSEWAGKYVCPVHPRDEASADPGVCPESKMQLRPASSFGYADEQTPELPLVIPASAPLITGKRSIVYVEVPGDRPTFELREVALGPRAGDSYVVYKGLKEGERVVTKGNFKIDSAMQILAKSSMMAPVEEPSAKASEEKTEEEVIEKIPAPHEFLESLTPVIKAYLNLKEVLVEEKPGDASQSGARMDERLKEVRRDLLGTRAYASWNKYLDSMTKDLKTIVEQKEIEAQRKAFDPLSETFVKVVMGFRHVMAEPLVVFHCPMAFNRKGAYWVEGSEDRRNPYFGTKPFNGQDMLKCGELVEKVPPEHAVTSAKPDTPGADVKVEQEKQSPEPKTAKDAPASETKPDKDKKTSQPNESKSESKAPGGKSGESHSHNEGRDK